MSDAPALPLRQQRLRAVGLTGLALGVALGSAWAVSQSRTAPLPLGDRVAPKDWPIAVRLPAGWKHEIDEADRWTGQLTARPREADGMRLIVKHTREYVGGDALAVAEQYLTERFTTPATTYASVEEMPIGPVLGIRALVEIESDSASRSVEVAVAALPTGQSVILMIVSPSSRSARLHRTLRSVCGSIEFVHPRLGPSADPLAAEIGLTCPTPSGTLCVEATDAHHPVAAFVADAASEAGWSAEVWRTILVAPRTLEDLAFDAAMTGSLRLDADSPPQRIEVEGRAAAFIESDDLDRFRSTWAVDLGGGTVAMLQARGTDQARSAIQAACRTLVAGVKPRDQAPAFDAAAAAKLGGVVVQEVRRRGLPSFWSKPDGTDWYLLRRFGEARGYHRERHERTTTTGPARDTADEFNGSIDSEIRYTDDARQMLSVVWTSDASGDAFETESTLAFVAGGVSRKLVTRVTRNAGKNDVQITTEVGGESRTATAGTPDNFVPDPLEDAALRWFASMNAGREMITLETSWRARRPAAVFSRLESDGDNGRSVWQWSDYSADRQRYVLDASGAIERVVIDEGVETVRSDRARVERALGWFRDER